MVAGTHRNAVMVDVGDKSETHRIAIASARITMEPETQDYGGSGYTCTDPEGHVWSFGDYDPWDADSA